MILDFDYYNPTRIHFGKNALSALPEELSRFEGTVLLLYGRSSIKRSGLYDRVVGVLQEQDRTFVELSGVKSNPTYAQLMEGVRLVRENRVGLILAVGGGSVIDCAKGISVAAYCEGDPWQRYWIDFEPVSNPLVPVGCILTMSGTGSEMNGGSVITNEAVTMKCGRTYSADVNPRFSILNPELTFTVPKGQMASGIFDTMSHLMEQYFSGEDDNTTDYILEGLMQSLLHSARIALRNPLDYEARSNLMWCATMGLNTVTGLSKAQDWEVHMIEHQLGAYTDCPHGAGLAVLSPAYYRYIYRYGTDRFVRFAGSVWGLDTAAMTKEAAALAGIEKLEDFIRELGLPASLRELGASREMLPKIAETCVPGGGYRQMDAKDILAVLDACY